MEWIVIMNADGSAIGIYSAKMRDMAERTLSKINDGMPEMFRARLVVYKASSRPCIGQIIKEEPVGDPPYPWCMHPRECIGLGRCPRNPNCGD